MEFTKSEAKQWAEQNLKGLEAMIFPSFSPDMTELDEEGIRHDVQNLIANGFKVICCAIEMCGMTFEERKKFVAIVNDEARNKVYTSVSVLGDTIEEDLEMLKHQEKVGGTFALLGHPFQFFPQSVDEIYRQYKYMCDNTNLAIIFYPGRLHVRKFHPSLWPLSTLPLIADLDNVVGMKPQGGSGDAFLEESYRLCGDKILIGGYVFENWPATIIRYKQQWACTFNYAMFQTPDNPLCVKMFDLCINGELEQSMDIYWKLAPIREAFFQTSAPGFSLGIGSPLADKYWHWCNGGNGGLLRQPIARLYDYQKDLIRNALTACGFTPREPEEEFYLGRTNYAKGARLRRF